MGIHGPENDPNRKPVWPKPSVIRRMAGLGYCFDRTKQAFLNGINPTIMADVRGHIFSGGIQLKLDFEWIKDPTSKKFATDYFSHLKTTEPFNAWAENDFLEMLAMVATNTLGKPILPKTVMPIDMQNTSHKKHFIDFSETGERRKLVQNLGWNEMNSMQFCSPLFMLDLAAGMATSFGGAVKGIINVRRDESDSATRLKDFIDIKREDYLRTQKMLQKHIIAGVLVSEATQNEILENLKNFAEKSKMELVLIYPEMSKKQIKKLWNENKTRWDKCIIVPVLKQPSTLAISDGAERVGKPYMSGPGNLFKIAQNQLKDIFEIFGLRYQVSSNIDNTAALISRTNFGLFLEATQRGTQAMLEFAQKLDGDRAGVPYMDGDKLKIMEPSRVPDDEKLKEEVLGSDIFKLANTNTLWMTAETLFNTQFKLPFINTGRTQDGCLKIESAVSDGLYGLKWKGLIVDRGTRFMPIKTLFELWRARTDCVEIRHGRARWAMEDGNVINIPLAYVSPGVMSNVKDLEDNTHLGGSNDSMKHMNMLYIGPDSEEPGDKPHKLGYQTNCAVTYEGNVMVIYETLEGQPAGTLKIIGKSEDDRLKIKDSIIFVPAGRTVEIRSSKVNEHDKRVTREMLTTALCNVKTWPRKRKAALISRMFQEEDKMPALDSIITQDMLSGLTQISKDQIKILKKLLKLKGMFIHNTLSSGNDILIKVDPTSRRGIGNDYESKAENEFVVASPEKEFAVKTGKRIVLEVKGGKMVVVSIPMTSGREKKLINLIGVIDESVTAEDKLKMFSEKLSFVKNFIKEKRRDVSDETIEKVFADFKCAALLKSSASDIASQICGSLPPIST